VIRRVFRVVSYTLLCLLAVIMLMIALVALLGGTDRGFSWSSQFIDNSSRSLAFASQSGNLGRGVVADSIEFDNGNMHIKLTGVDTQWRIECLLKLSFCLDNLTIQEVYIEPRPYLPQLDEQAVVRGDIQLPDIKLPIAIAVDNVLIGKVTYQPTSGAKQHTLKQIKLSIKAKDSLISLDKFSLQYEQFDASLSGELSLVDDYPIDLGLVIKSDDVLPDQCIAGWKS